MVENKDTWRYCINCISWSNRSCMYDIMWFRDVRVHVTFCVFLQISMENNKAMNMEGCQQCALFVQRHKPNKLIFFIVWIIFKQLAWKIPIGRFLNCFFDCQFENRWVVDILTKPKSCKFIWSSRGQKNTFWAWTLAILVLKLLPWRSIQERVFTINLQPQVVHFFHKSPINFFQLFLWWFQVIQYFWIGSNASFKTQTINVYFVSGLGRKSIFTNIVLKNQKRTCCGCLAISSPWRYNWI